MEDKIEYLREKIRQDEIKDCLNELTTIIKPEQKIFNDIIIIFGRFNRLQKNIIMGLVESNNSEINKIGLALLSIIDRVKDADLIENSNNNTTNTDFIKIADIVNPNFEGDIKNIEGDWNIYNTINTNTILIVTGVHFFPEMLDRVSAYSLQNIINKKGAFKDCKRAVVVGDMPYEYVKSQTLQIDEKIINNLSVLSIGGPSINNTSLEIIENKDKTLSNSGVNITY